MKKILSIAVIGTALVLSGCMEAETDIPMTESVNQADTVTPSQVVDSQPTTGGGTSDTATSNNTSSDDLAASKSGVMTEDMYEIEIDNQTGSDIYGLQYSITGSQEWGEEYSNDMITNGDTTQITVPKGEEGEMFDLRAYDNEDKSGDGWIFPEIDFTNDGRIILRYKDNAPDYEYG